MRGISVLALTGALFLIVRPAAAETYALNVGFMENVALTPDVVHAGLYPCVGPAVTWTVGPTSVTASLMLDFALDTGYWGFTPTVNVDFPVHDALGVDVFLTGWSDQRGMDFDGAAGYFGGGVGVSWFITKRLTLSPSLTVVGGVRGTNAVVLVPGAIFSVAL